VIRKVFQNEDRSPPRCVPEVLVMEVLAKLAVPKLASGRMVTVDPTTSAGASLIASALLRRQVAPAGQALVRVKCWPLVVSEKLSVNLRVDLLYYTERLIASPGLTGMFGSFAAFGNISQNGAYTGVVLVPSHPASRPICSTVVDEDRKPSSPTQCPDHAPLAAVTPVQSTVGTVNCADTKRKVVVPKLAAYPAQLTD
jgi:hypothetical protein